jgi:hypothetical protein
MKKNKSTIGAVLLMILGFKADLNKYYQSKVVKEGQQNNEFRKIKENGALNLISVFTQEKKNELIFEEKRIQYLFNKSLSNLKNKLVTKKQYENMF